MSEQTTKTSGFNSRIGVILAAAGSAIGLGNIWKFPYVMGANGGGVFLVVYLICVLLFGLPLMLTEFLLGKQTGMSAFGAFRAIRGGNHWQWLSWWCIMSTTLYLAFYFVIASWCGNYLFEAITNAYVGIDVTALSAHFKEVVSDAPRMIIFVVLQVVLSAGVLWFGVQNGLERLSKILMPMMLLLMIGMIVYVLLLEGGAEGLRYMFHFDFSQITPKVVMMAVGQCFFSLSVGAGMMIIFGAYMPKVQDATTTSMMVILLDTLVALLAGLIIFPAVFAFGFSPTEGPQLVYAVLPAVFQKMSFTWMTGVCFFLLLFMAAMSSTVAIMEVLVANLTEAGHGKLKRHHAILIAASISLVLAIVCVLSISNVFGNLTIAGHNMFECMDLLITTILLPIGALCMSLFLGWFMPLKNKDAIPVSKKTWKRFLRPAFIFALRWIVPIAILLILLNGFGVFG